MTAASRNSRARARGMKDADPERSNAGIARELGVSTSIVWAALNPERSRELRRADNARRAKQKREWENEHDRGVCGCGALLTVGARRRGVTQCRPCSDAAKRAARLERARIIERMWATGDSIVVIAHGIGMTPAALGVEMHRLRVKGLADLPYRYRRVSA